MNLKVSKKMHLNKIEETKKIVIHINLLVYFFSILIHNPQVRQVGLHTVMCAQAYILFYNKTQKVSENKVDE